MQGKPLQMLTASMLLMLCVSPLTAQRRDGSGGRGPSDFMRRMDANRNGYLEPNEISDRARPYLERYAQIARLSMSRPLSISRLEQARAQYYRQGEAGASPSTRGGVTGGAGGVSDSAGTIPDFAPLGDEPRVPGFGADAELMANLTQEDIDRATSRLKEYDRNRDGFLDRSETSDGRWSEDPFQYDANHDNRLSPPELAQRYARRRVNEARAEVRSSASARRSDGGDRGRRDDGGDRGRRGEGYSGRFGRFGGRGGSGFRGNRSLWYLAASVMGRYDADRDGALNPTEWEAAGIESRNSDRDGDGRISRDELVAWLDQRWAESSPLPQGLPDWFAASDADKDGQVRMAEFATEWTDEKVAEFAKYDRDGDGIVTVNECVGLAKLMRGSYVNNDPQMILPRTVASSEIDVADEAIIGNLAVQLSITHSEDQELDAFLIGPDGQRIELFTRVGGDGDHFDNTIFDDNSGTPVARGRAPFTGTFRPESADNNEQPSLKYFNGKPIRGVWRLEIRADRSDRIGMLHAWSLIVRRMGAEGQPVEAALETNDSPPEGRRRFEGGPPGGDFRRWRRGGRGM